MFRATLKLLTIFVMICGVQHVVARPHEREKRVSDSHLSNLETISTLNKYKRRLAQTTPIDWNSISPYNVNKRLLSSSYLSDLQTQIGARNNIKGIAIKIPVGAGMLDPKMIGRKRRSDPGLVDPLLLDQFSDYPTERPTFYDEESDEKFDKYESPYPYLEYLKTIQQD